MDKNKITNFFQEAIEKKELEAFIIGENKYFVADREYGGHWPYGSYKKFMESYLVENNNLLPQRVWGDIENIFIKSEKLNVFLDYLVIYLHIYYNLSEKNINQIRVKNTPSEFIKILRNVIKNNKECLLNDIRGTGVEWHSKNGLWGSINNKLKIIKENGGPDFLVDEFV